MANINNLTARGRHLLQTHIASLSAALTGSEGKEILITGIRGIQFSPAETMQTSASQLQARTEVARFALSDTAGTLVCSEQGLRVGSHITTEQAQQHAPAGYVQHKIRFWSSLPTVDAPASSVAWIDNQKELDEAARQAQATRIDQLEAENQTKNSELTRAEDKLKGVRTRIAELEQELEKLYPERNLTREAAVFVETSCDDGNGDDSPQGSDSQPPSRAPSPIVSSPTDSPVPWVGVLPPIPYYLQAPGPLHQPPPVDLQGPVLLPPAHTPPQPTTPQGPVQAPPTAPPQPAAPQGLPPASFTYTPPLPPMAPPIHTPPQSPSPEPVVDFRALKYRFEKKAELKAPDLSRRPDPKPLDRDSISLKLKQFFENPLADDERMPVPDKAPEAKKPAGTGDSGKPDKTGPVVVTKKIVFGVDRQTVFTRVQVTGTGEKIAPTQTPAQRLPIGATGTSAPSLTAEARSLRQQLTVLRALALTQAQVPADGQGAAAAAPPPPAVPISEILGASQTNQDELIIRQTQYLLAQLTVLSTEVQKLAEGQHKPGWTETKELRGRITLMLTTCDELMKVIERTVHASTLGKVLVIVKKQLTALASEASLLGLNRTSTLVTSTGLGHSTVLSRGELHVMRPMDSVGQEIERIIHVLQQRLSEVG